MVSKKELAIALTELEGFEEAKRDLEQYATDGNLAAELLWDAHMKGLLAEKTVIDLGAGTGILAIGAALLGAKVSAIEKDPDAVTILRRNLQVYEGTEDVRVIEGDIRGFSEKGDLVIMNPPFGTKERHADRVFLEKAIAIAPLIYTIHKTTTATFVRGFAKEAGYEVVQETEWRFPLRRTMAHHEKDREHISATLFLIRRR